MATRELVISQSEMREWRQDFHRHPETAFEEIRTAATVADRLRQFGLQVTTGIGRTGVVGTLRNSDGPGIALRADMDALHISEENSFGYRSQTPGKMHACGHDGHMTMLLGAARHLAETRRFKGTVQFIFQPAEENEAGGKAMIDDGLFERFPADTVYGMHNWPGLQAGHFDLCKGPIMAAFDTFEITINGFGTHAAMPHLGRDAVLASGHIVASLQSIVSRLTDPQSAAVVSVTQIHGGDTWNVIPETVQLRGCTRHFTRSDQDLIEAEVTNISNSIAIAHGVEAVVDYKRRYPTTVNSAVETEHAAAAAALTVGADLVGTSATPSLASEDFAFMLQERPGCYIRIGNGPEADGRTLHNPRYDFNDEVLPVGAAYWVNLVEDRLG